MTYVDHMLQCNISPISKEFPWISHRIPKEPEIDSRRIQYEVTFLHGVKYMVVSTMISRCTRKTGYIECYFTWYFYL